MTEMNYDKMTTTTSVSGDIVKTYTLNGLLHRLDGPAIDKTNGSQSWYLNGKRHRDSLTSEGIVGPAVIYSNGDLEWYLNDLRHRVDGPAEIGKNEEKWFKHGKLHRDSLTSEGIVGPAIVRTNGYQAWCIEGMFHREDGPAIINTDGTESWYKNNELHREDGPAVIMKNGNTKWYQLGKLHRVCGPAIESKCNPEKNRWYLCGIEYTKDEYDNGVEAFIPRDTGVIEFIDRREYYLNGMLHRVGAPAVEYHNGDEIWYMCSKEHRVDGPSWINKIHGTRWSLCGKTHRVDGPAVDRPDGYKSWYQCGVLHREDGPAIVHGDGTEFWCQNGKYHRIDGPAVTIDGKKEWYIDGEQYTESVYRAEILKRSGKKYLINIDGIYHTMNKLNVY